MGNRSSSFSLPIECTDQAIIPTTERCWTRRKETLRPRFYGARASYSSLVPRCGISEKNRRLPYN